MNYRFMSGVDFQIVKVLLEIGALLLVNSPLWITRLHPNHTRSTPEVSQYMCKLDQLLDFYIYMQ